MNNQGLQNLMNEVVNLLPDPKNGGNADINLLKDCEAIGSLGQVYKIMHKQQGKGKMVPHAYFRVYKGSFKPRHTVFKFLVDDEDENEEAATTKNDQATLGKSDFKIQDFRTAQLFKPFGVDSTMAQEISTGEIGLIKSDKELKFGDLIFKPNTKGSNTSLVSTANNAMSFLSGKMSGNEFQALINVTSKFSLKDALMYMALHPTNEKDFDKVLTAFQQYKKEDPGISIKLDEENGTIILGTQGKIQNELFKSRFEREHALDVEFGPLLLNNHERMEILHDKALLGDDALKVNFKYENMVISLKLFNDPDLFYNWIYRYQNPEEDPNSHKHHQIDDYKRMISKVPFIELTTNQVRFNFKQTKNAINKAANQILDKSSSSGAKMSQNLIIEEIGKTLQKSVIRKMNQGTFSKKSLKFPSWTVIEVGIAKIFSEDEQPARKQSSAKSNSLKNLQKPIPGTHIYRTALFNSVAFATDDLLKDQEINVYGPIAQINISLKHSYKDKVTEMLYNNYSIDNLKFFYDNENIEDSLQNSIDPEITLFGTVSLGSLDTLSEDLRSVTGGTAALSCETGEFGKIESF